MNYKKTIIILSCISALLLVALIGIIIYSATAGSQKAEEKNSSSATVTDPATPDEAETPDSPDPSAPVGTEATQPTEAPTEPAPTEAPIDEELAALLAKKNLTPQDIKAANTSQIVTVSSSGTDAEINFWQLKDGVWSKDPELSVAGYVGQMGVTDEMSEYVAATPAGFYPVTEAFFINDKPETGLDVFEITYETYWVDDPESKYYNKRVEGTDDQDWSSAEQMVYYSVYEYGFVVGYNLECEKGKGSAIFFHCGDEPTSGCIATDESNVLAYLAALNKEANPYILIV